MFFCLFVCFIKGQLKVFFSGIKNNMSA